MKIPFVGPSYNVEAISFDCQRSINLYMVQSEVGTSKSAVALRKTPGTRLAATAPGGPIRGGLASTSNRAFYVSAQYFVEQKTDGSVTTWGSLATQSVRVCVVESITQVLVVDGQDGWIFTKATNVWAKITSPNFPKSSFATYQDGYFIVIEDGTQNYWISGINDGFTWGALDFTTVESSPDALTAVFSNQENLWCVGNRSIEIHQNTGAAAFPFERIPGAVIQTGCEAPFTIQKFAGSIAWLGTDEQGQGVVWVADGYAAKRISTAAIEKRIASVVNFSSAWSFVYHEQGHLFYCLQIPGLNTTLCCDASTGFQWTERMFFNLETNAMELHRASCCLFFNRKIYVGDRVTGKIFQMSLDFYDDEGTPQVWKRISPHQQDEKRLLTYAAFELDVEVGRGLANGQGSDPQICLRYSKDGGRSWSSELWRTLGKVGAYFTRACWRQLGQARDMVFEVSGSDPVFIQLNEATVNAT